jgi:hypothetical protein
MDRPDIIHIQYEFTTFGPLWANITFPLLLVFAKLARVKIVVTVHSVIPKKSLIKNSVQQLIPQLSKIGVGEGFLKCFWSLSIDIYLQYLIVSLFTELV